MPNNFIGDSRVYVWNWPIEYIDPMTEMNVAESVCDDKDL